MAIPTITNITPNTGYSFGVYIITIEGTNFRIPDQVPGASETQESVRVSFDGVLCEIVYVFSETELSVRVPSTLINPNHNSGNNYPYIVDVVVENIDASGSVIPGESVALVEGFSYVKFELNNTANPSIAAIIWKQVVRYFRRHFDMQIVGISNVDYSSDPTQIPLPDSVPKTALVLLGPIFRSNPTMTERFQQDARSNHRRKRTPVAKDFIYNIIGTSNRKFEMDNFMMAFDQAIRSPHNFSINWDGADYDLQLWLEKEPANGGLFVAASSVTQFLASVRVDGVPMVSDVTESLQEITDIELNVIQL